MQNISKVLKQLSLVYFTALGLTLFALICPVFLFFSLLSRISPKAKTLYYIIIFLGAKLYICLSPIRFDEKNVSVINDFSKNFSKDKFLVVANHRSHLDVFILLTIVFKMRAVANAKLFKIPGLGLVMKLLGNFPMERGNIEVYKRTLKNIQQAFNDQHTVLFFPEMTRCHPGEEGIQKFRLTAFQLARENNIQIIPIVLSDTDFVWPKGHVGMDFRKKISVVALKAVNPKDFSNSADLSIYVHTMMEKKLMELNS
jgi:1-acyl-sn-glycerol-3-phosphate acyltransferase